VALLINSFQSETQEMSALLTVTNDADFAKMKYAPLDIYPGNAHSTLSYPLSCGQKDLRFTTAPERSLGLSEPGVSLSLRHKVRE